MTKEHHRDIVEEARDLDAGAYATPAHYAAHLEGLCQDLADEVERLRELLRPFAALPVQELGQCQRHPDHPVFAINGVSFNATDVLQAREALGE